MTSTTLQLGNVEKSFADWGISSWNRDQQNLASDHLQLTIPAPMDEAPVFAYGAHVIGRIGRVASAPNPLNPSLPVSVTSVPSVTYSGGSQWFWGYRDTEDRIGSGSEESLVYKFVGPFEWFFERLVFQQSMLTFFTSLTKMIRVYKSNVILGMSLNALTGESDTVAGTTQTNLLSIAQQIKQIAMYAQADSAYQQSSNGLAWPDTAVAGQPAHAQFQCDQLTVEVDGINFDLLESPSATLLLDDYYLGAESGQTSANLYPGSVTPTAAVYQLRAPLDAVNAITCKEALQREIAWLGSMGTVLVWMDHSQTPPQLHLAASDQCRAVLAGAGNTLAARLAGGNAISLPFSGITVKQKIKRRDDLIPAAVAFKYNISGTFLNASYNITLFDIAAYLTATGVPGAPGAPGVSLIEGIGQWGALYDATNPTVLLSGGLQTALINLSKTSMCLLNTLDFQGAGSKAQSCAISADSIADALGSASDAVWPKIFTGLANASSLAFYNSDSPSITINDAATGAALYSGGAWTGTAYSNWVVDGQVAPWMLATGGTPENPVAGQTVKAVIRVNFAYDEKTMGPSGDYAIAKHVAQKEWSATVTLTTLTTGTYYSTPTFSQGEPIPWGLAGYICETESIPQYEGSVTVQENEITDLCPIGNVLNITGGRAEWAAMFAVVQQVSYADNGQTNITFGPAKHLGADKMVQRFRTNIGRQWFDVLSVNPMNTQGSSPGELGSNIPALAPTEGGENIGMQQWLTDPTGQQGADGNVATSPAGITLDSGAAANPQGFTQGQQIILTDGVDTSSPFIRIANVGDPSQTIIVNGLDADITEILSLLDGGTAAQSGLSDNQLLINDDSATAPTIGNIGIGLAGAAPMILITDGTVDGATPSDFGIAIYGATPQLLIDDGTNTAKLDSDQLAISNGSDSIVAALADISGKGEAKFRFLTFCQDGSSYSAGFLMTTPVSV